MTLADPTAETRAELIWIGSGAWVACDMNAPEHDPHRVLAFLECRQQHVDVTWVRKAPRTERFDGLREALLAIQGG
jgi:hypothetical protein